MINNLEDLFPKIPGEKYLIKIIDNGLILYNGLVKKSKKIRKKYGLLEKKSYK